MCGLNKLQILRNFRMQSCAATFGERAAFHRMYLNLFLWFLGAKLFTYVQYIFDSKRWKWNTSFLSSVQLYLELPNQHHGMHLHDVRRPLFDVFGVVLLSLSQKLVSLWLIHQSVSPLGATFSCFGLRVKCSADNGFVAKTDPWKVPFSMCKKIF